MNTTTLVMNAESLELEVLGRRFPLNWTDRKPGRKVRIRQLTPTTEQRQLKDVVGDGIWTKLEWSTTTTPDDSSEKLVAAYILSLNQLDRFRRDGANRLHCQSGISAGDWGDSNRSERRGPQHQTQRNDRRGIV